MGDEDQNPSIELKRDDFRRFKGIEREVVYEHGARFFRADGKVMFGYRSSANTEFVRLATAEDAQAHSSEWKQFTIHEKGPPRPRGWPKGKPRK